MDDRCKQMVNLANIVGQTADRFDYRLGQRQEMAKAFELFKKNNPLATVADFQNFIDQHAGGNNYIAGGAPGKEVLQRIAASNAAREAERQRNLRIANYGKELEFIQKLTPRINAALLNTKTKNGDLDLESSYKDFMELNPDLNDLDINVKDLFSPWRYNKIKSDMFAERSPQAYTYLENAEDPDKIDVSQFARLYTDGNETLAQELLDIQKTKFNKVQNEKLNAEVEKYSDKFNTLINTKNASGDYISPDEAKAMIMSQIENSPFKAKLEAGEWLDKTYEEGKVQAKNRLNEEKSLELRDLDADLKGDRMQQILEATMATGGRDKAKEFILENYKDMVTSPYWETTEGKTELDKWLDTFLDKTIALSNKYQDTNENTRKKEVQANLTKALSNVKTENKQVAIDLFSDSNAKVLAGNIGSIPMIAQAMSDKFYMDNKTKNLIVLFGQNVAPGLDEDTKNNVLALQDMLENFLTEQGATPLSTRIEQIQSVQGLSPMSRTMFKDYKGDLETHVQEHQAKFSDTINTVIENTSNSQNKEDYLSAIRVLNSMKNQYRDWTKRLGKKIQYDYDTRIEWVDIGGDRYDKDLIDGIFGDADKDYLFADIDRKIEELSNTANNLQPSSTDANERALTDNRTQAEKEQDALRAKLEFNKNKPKYENIPVDVMDWNIFGGSPWKKLTDRQAIIQKGIEDFFVSNEPREIWQELGLNAKLDGVEFNYQDFVDTPIDWILTNDKAKEIAKRIWGENRYKRIEEAYLAENQ